jgi:hypothetical protein
MDSQGVEAEISTYVSKLEGAVPGGPLDPWSRLNRSADNLRQVMANQGYSIVFSNIKGPIYDANCGHLMSLQATASPCTTESGCIIPKLVEEAGTFFGRGTVVKVTQQCPGCTQTLRPLSEASPNRDGVTIGTEE